MSAILLLLILFFLSLVNTIPNDHFCGFNEEPPLKELPQSGVKNALSTPDPSVPYTPYRIFYDYTHLDDQLEKNRTLLEYIFSIKNVLETSKDAFQKVMTFQRRSELLSVGDWKCSGLLHSDRVLNTGVEADMIIIPFIDYNVPGSTLASAGPCWLTEYPYLGQIRISTKLNFTRESNQYFVSLFMHEMTHIFVFNKSLYPNFRDQNGKAYANVTIKRVVNGVQRTLMATPKVIAAAKKHFNCDTLEGLALEDQGGDGTALSHWEARVMLGDYMIGVTYIEMFFSDITMALFEDSGWYKMNYYTGGLFKYGIGEGCPFLHDKCMINQHSTNPKYFGTYSYQPMCLQGRTTKGFCYLSTDVNIPKEYQYFKDPTLGGYMHADYCPIARTGSQSERRSPSNCKTGIIENEKYGEEISENSNCFISSLVLNTVETQHSAIAICYKFKCDFSKQVTLVTVMNKQIECPTEGGNKTFAEYNGIIVCPKFSEICTATALCYDISECIDKKSILKSSYAKLNTLLFAFIIALLLV